MEAVPPTAPVPVPVVRLELTGLPGPRRRAGSASVGPQTDNSGPDLTDVRRDVMYSPITAEDTGGWAAMGGRVINEGAGLVFRIVSLSIHASHEPHGMQVSAGEGVRREMHHTVPGTHVCQRACRAYHLSVPTRNGQAQPP